MKYFSHLYFAVTLDVEDVLTSVGIEVKIGTSGNMTTISWASDIGALGGDREQLDSTPLVSPVRINKSGVEDRQAWEVEYFHNNAEFVALNAMKTAGTEQDIEIVFPDGSKQTNKGVVTGNYQTDITVNSMIKDKVTVDLSGEWTYTAPTP